MYVSPIDPGSIGSNQTLCGPSVDPSLLTNQTSPSGSGWLSYQWQSSTGGCSGSFTDISGATGLTYDPPAGLTTTTTYRRVVISSNGCTAISNCVTVYINNVTGGELIYDQVICSGGDPVGYTQTIASTGTGTLTYQWQSSTTKTAGCDVGFTNIPGATGLTYDPPSGATYDLFYRRVTTSTLNGVACTAISNCLDAYVNNVTGGTVGNDQTFCLSGDPAPFTVLTAATGDGTLTYKWQSSTTSCTAGFTDIAGATGATYDAPAGLTTTTYYRRVTTSTLWGTPCTANSNCITVTINNVTAGVVGSDQTICSGGNPAAFTVTTPATGLGTLTYQWQSSTTSCSTGFADISGATSATYDAPAGLTTTTYYRRIVIAALNGVTCSFTSNCITVTINNVTGGALTSDQVVCTGGDPASFTQTTASTGSGTLTYQWQSSTTKSATCDVGFTNIPGATGITYDPPSGATSNLFYRRVTTSTLNGVACTAISNCLSVYVNNVTGGTVGSDQSFCSSGDPAPFTVLTASTGDGTLTYKWQSSTTSCTAGFTDIAGATSATYDAPAGLATTTYYRRVTTSTLYGTPCTATSNCITVTIYPPATVDAGFST
ncbi:MAG TPA: hypothetical protein PKD78_09010, partial [Saprospiraceae bacterium]|nr:hypothetical protein [Saprospiraceae bacterium]